MFALPRYRCFLLAVRLFPLFCAFATPLEAAAVLTPPADIVSRGLHAPSSGRLGEHPPGVQGNTRLAECCGYNLASGRPEWLSRDPIGERGGLNLYGYVNNAPANNMDRDGLLELSFYIGAATGGYVGYATSLSQSSLSRSWDAISGAIAGGIGGEVSGLISRYGSQEKIPFADIAAGVGGNLLSTCINSGLHLRLPTITELKISATIGAGSGVISQLLPEWPAQVVLGLSGGVGGEMANHIIGLIQTEPKKRTFDVDE